MTTYSIGDTATHDTFGAGLVLEVGHQREGGTVVTVDFGDPVGTKKFLTAYSPLTLAKRGETRQVTFDDDNIAAAATDEMKKILIRRRVKDLLDQQALGEVEPFDVGLLREVLARPDEPPARIEGLIPWNASTLLVAQRKTGKTTFILNWARSLLSGEDFLGRFPVERLGGKVAILNFEVSAHTLARWADEHDVNPDKLLLVNLRGRRNPLSHDEDRERLCEVLREHDVEAVAVDPFGRAFTGKSQNDAGEVTAWLVALDTFVRSEVGASDLLLATHAGWNGERSRGSTALEDWADVVVTLTRDGEDESQRFLRAMGRDVEVDEDRLDFDASTRTLRLAGVGSRKKSKDDKKIAELAVLVARAVRESPGAHLAALEAAVKDMDDAPTFRNGDVSKAATFAAQQGFVRIESAGAGRRNAYFAVDNPTPPDPSPTHPGDDPTTPPTPPIWGGVGVGMGVSAKPSPKTKKGAVK